jgi:hypothetical protein
MRHLLAALLWLAASAPARAAEGSHSAVGDARLAPGLDAHYAYHYDRNVLRDSRLAGDALIALTRSGNLLRFDAKTLKPTREWFGPVPAVCLGRGENDAVLVGFEDGRICRVDPATLTLTEVAKLPGKVQWVGESKATGGQAGIVTVVEHTRWAEQDGERYQAMSSTVHDVASGKVYSLDTKTRDRESGKDVRRDRHATAFLLDSKRRLWLGADQGEWGGWCVRIDLDADRLVEVEGIKRHPGIEDSGWYGVYGFAELPDGQVWAHGGMMHMGFTEGFIRRVDGPKVEELYRFGNGDARKGHENNEKIPEPKQPYLPISHVMADGDGKPLVFSYSNIYHVDTGLKAWSKDEPLRLRYRQGRPDAVGAYPSIVAVHRIDGRLICATGVDGYISIADGKDASHALPGQFGLDRTWQIINSAEGVLYSARDDHEPTWRLKADGWKVVDLAPPCELAPDDALVGRNNPSWAETRVMVGPGGTVVTVSASSMTRTTARRLGDKSEILGREKSSLNVPGCFITPDGALWSTWFGDLLRFADGRWRVVADLPGAAPRDEHGVRTDLRGLEVGRGARTIGDAGPPWLLLDRDETQLLSLVYGSEFKDPKLDAVRITEAGAALKILDAIPLSKGELLLATDKGLRRFEIASAKVQPSPLPVPDRPVTSLARDGLGRVWLAGEGLWVVDADGKRLHDCGSLPMMGRTEIVTIAADPERRDGVIVSLGERGVAFVRVSAEAAR